MIFEVLYGSDHARVQYDSACAVDEVDTAVYRVVSSASTPGQSISPITLCLWEVLDQWGSMWMWEDLELTGGFEFIVAGIIDSSLVCVADGSSIKEMYPHICSAAFIMECSKGRGRIIGKFSDKTLAACIGYSSHFISGEQANFDTFSGSTQIYSDCSLGGSPQC